MKVNVTKITCLFSLCLCDFFYLYCLRKLFLKLEQILQLRHRFVDSLIKNKIFVKLFGTGIKMTFNDH